MCLGSRHLIGFPVTPFGVGVANGVGNAIGVVQQPLVSAVGFALVGLSGKGDASFVG